LEVTNERKLERKLKDEKSKLDFFTGLSHEFRTPLNLMHTSLQLFEMQFLKLKTNSKMKNKLKSYLNIIEQNNYRLLKLVNNLLDVTKMDSGKYTINLQNKNIVNSVKNIILSSKDIAEKQNKNLIFKSNIKYKIISFDPFEIERVLLNLISNAFKFTGPGDKIIARLKEEKGSVIIEVEDTGIGIPEKNQKEIFGKFSQVDSFHHRQGEGSGLGLSIVKLILEMHKGEILLESESGSGSIFTIRLPDRQIPENMVNEYQKNINETVDRLDVEYSDIYSYS
jgi:signal transduction histidine kinase